MRWLRHTIIEIMLQKVTGIDSYPIPEVRNVQLSSGCVFFEFLMQFDQNNLPPNFQKKGRELLRFKANTVGEYELEIIRSDVAPPSSILQSISDNRVILQLGSNELSVKCDKIVEGGFLTQSYSEAVDSNWAWSKLGPDRN